ncbi:unnamed protein product [Didymodactylos carnosus]|uniref:Uncharacterized protein n=1 Tax=Didymodactylos carnosus TaxID=1234261 RepID=A0A8S2GTH6_9BILA|nr:unnamed protein product [Didymodactylos carnosus]CAF3560615.1 unnamed protein product [Didymodactylos carnosus]
MRFVRLLLLRFRIYFDERIIRRPSLLLAPGEGSHCDKMGDILSHQGSCAYSTGDCIADATSGVTCGTDTISCLVYASSKKLPQCDDKNNNYLHIEYQCVPIIMQDSTKVYGVCQNSDTDITSDHGIIISPGYPTQFQTTTNECFRSIHVPDNKLIQLWLTDLYIGSSPSQDCPKDHVLVVDSVSTYRHCNIKRFAYPLLCSSSIIIQYYATTNSVVYKGMRLYFEIVDRPPSIHCPQVTVTPVPLSTITGSTTPHLTTTLPLYAQLVIASPKFDIQLCKDDFQTITCPMDFVAVINTMIYAVVPSNQCEPFNLATHCSVTEEPNIYCRRTCTLSYYGNKFLPACSNQEATYRLVSYQCVPDKAPVLTANHPCTGGPDIYISKNGEFISEGYPYISQTENCTYHLKTDVDKIMNIYALDITLSDFDLDCKTNSLTIIDGDNRAVFCDVFYGKIIHSSCSNEIDINYSITDSHQIISYGARLYIEAVQRPADHCDKTDPMPTTSTTVTHMTPTIPTIIPEPFSGALNETNADICFGDTPSFACPSGYTFIIIDAFFGVKKSTTDACRFQQGDCIQSATSTITTCQHDDPICYLPYTVKRKLARCQDLYADYMHVIYQCIPNKGLTPDLLTYDVCQSSDMITAFNGLLTSPGFPKYQTVNPECKRPIETVRDKAVKIWINEMATSSGILRTTSDDESQPLAKSADLIIHRSPSSLFIDATDHIRYGLRDICPKDYLIINGAVGISYVFCGTRKLVLPPICATEVYIQYYAPAAPNLFYKGFKLYFEQVPKPMDGVECGIGHTENPNLSTTTEDPSTLPIWAQNFELSPIFSQFLCHGFVVRITCPSTYVVSIDKAYYGVTGTGQCETPDNSHCKQDASLSLSCTHTCSVDYAVPQSLILCGGSDADYLTFDYQCIPTQLSNGQLPIDICSTSVTDTLAINRGMLTSPQYPQLGLQTRRCSKTLQTNSNQLWAIYIVDLNIEGADANANCIDASLTLYDGKDRITLCGSQQPQQILTSCSETVQIEFVSNRQAIGYRGFKLYFETINIPPNWACVPIGYSTLPSTMRPPQTTSKLPPSVLIQTYGGTTNETMRYCEFPFLYQNQLQSACLSSETAPIPGGSTDPWCSLTDNFDTDKQWGYCYLGVTQTTMYDICPSKTETLKCPLGYVIDIVASMYGTKNQDIGDAQACVYDANDCFINDDTTVQATCAGRSSCVVLHSVRTLASCQNRRSSYLHIDYICVPNTLPDIKEYDFCGSTTIITPTDDKPIRRGYIVSPNYPNTQPGIDCTITIQPNDQQDVYVYILDMQLDVPLLGQSCTKAKFIQTYDGLTQERCGRSSTNFLLNTCHSPLSLQLIKSSDSSSKGLKLYFEFINRPIDVVCVTPPPPMSSTKPTVVPQTTTEPPQPSWYPNMSPIMTKPICYLDLVSLFGNNIQCYNNYLLVIRRAFYGKGSKCGYTQGDCIRDTDYVYQTCAGKQGCAVNFIAPVTLSECGVNLYAGYLYVEYQCAPNLSLQPSLDLCSIQQTTLGDLSGSLISTTYPSYVITQCDNITLQAPDNSNMILRMYLLDLNIDAEDSTSGLCTNDYLIFSYNCDGQTIENKLCGTRKTQFLFETCNVNEAIRVSYRAQSQLHEQQGGFALHYQFLPKSVESTIPTVPTQPSTPPTVKTTTGSVPPITRPIEVVTLCAGQSRTLICPRNFVIVLLQIDLGVSEKNQCLFARNDCFEERTYLYGSCAGQTSCVIVYSRELPVAACSNRPANYLYAEYQCVPTSGQIQVNGCNNGLPIDVQLSASIFSTNYPTYTPSSQDCTVQLHAPRLLGSPHRRSFKIYIIVFNLPSTAISGGQGSQCDPVNDAYVEIYDDIIKTRLCGNLHTRYVFEICTDTLHIRFKDINKQISPSAKYKGFNIYVEAIDTNCPELVGTTIRPPEISQPFTIYDRVVCIVPGRERTTMVCKEHHGLVFLQSYVYSTSKPSECQISDKLCHYPSEQPQSLCTGQTSCSYIFMPQPYPLSFGCSVPAPDLINFQYECIPNRLIQQSPDYGTAVLCQDSLVTFRSGFIHTPNYPAYSYSKQCKLKILLSGASATNLMYIRLYVIDLSMRQSSTSSKKTNKDDSCYDSITYRDSKMSTILCGELEEKFLYESHDRELEIEFNTKAMLPTDDPTRFHGALLFFYIANFTSPATPPPSTTLEVSAPPSTQSQKPKKKAVTGVIIGILAGLCALVILVGILLYRKGILFNRRKTSPDVVYQQDSVAIQAPSTKKTGHEATSLTNPLYSQQTLRFQNHPNGTTDA